MSEEKRNSTSGQLLEIQKAVLALGELTENAIVRATGALQKRDVSIAHQIMSDDAKINERRFSIEATCIEVLAKQLLPAKDLRTIVSVLNIITELERIGDYADGIAKIVIMIGDEPPLKPLIDIPRMAEITKDMIHDSLQAFIDSDIKKAARVISMDNTIDSLYDQIFRELLTFMMSDPKTINRATRLIWVAHNLERAADRATNISERVVYNVTGKMEEAGESI